mmetsp:Transcript_3430/g.12365  ORF Transcript_3430/g.12365 Transcript_3430/m.12365 type:complete len:265 (-) Transcript_3430:43-837(-)
MNRITFVQPERQTVQQSTRARSSIRPLETSPTTSSSSFPSLTGKPNARVYVTTALAPSSSDRSGSTKMPTRLAPIAQSCSRSSAVSCSRGCTVAQHTEAKVKRMGTPESINAMQAALRAHASMLPSSSITCTMIDIPVLGCKLKSRAPSTVRLTTSASSFSRGPGTPVVGLRLTSTTAFSTSSAFEPIPFGPYTAASTALRSCCHRAEPSALFKRPLSHARDLMALPARPPALIWLTMSTSALSRSGRNLGRRPGQSEHHLVPH